jgi:mRNA-degrading endonuclease toxin of MazEF toxin-antitoxin module
LRAARSGSEGDGRRLIVVVVPNEIATVTPVQGVVSATARTRALAEEVIAAAAGQTVMTEVTRQPVVAFQT